MVFKLIGIDLSGLSQLAVEGAGQPLSGVGIGIILIGAYVLSLFIYLFIYAYVRTNILNTVWSNVNVGGNSFESNLSVKGMMWIYFTNGLGILLTLGLYTPWAMIRMTRYRINRLKVWADSNINEVIVKQQKEVSATGGEMSDFLDVDLAI